MHFALTLLLAFLLASPATAGTWTTNQFIYKPSLGAKGATEKNTFDTGLDRVDAHLGKHKTLGDPAYATLAEALTTIGSNHTTLVIPAGTVNIAANTTIPDNVHLQVLRGGKFSVPSGVTLTVNGPVEAGPYQIFACTGTGKVNCTASKQLAQVYPQWFGATGDGSTDDTTAIQKAIDSVAGCDIPVWFPKATYKMARQGSYVECLSGDTVYYCVKTNARVKLKGQGSFTIPIGDADYASAFIIYGTSGAYLTGVEISGLSFTGVGSPGTGGANETIRFRPSIKLEYCDGALTKDLKFANTKGGVHYSRCRNSLIHNCESANPAEGSGTTNPNRATHFGIYESSACTISNCRSWGGSGDGDIVILGTGEGNAIEGCQAHNFAKSDYATKATPFHDAQGLLLDSGSYKCRIVNSYAYGYSYGIDLKSTIKACVAQGNTVEKCWVGIAVRNGEQGGYPTHTVIDGNTILPHGGNGKTGTILSISPTLTCAGILTDYYNFGTLISNNNIGHDPVTVNGNSDFAGMILSCGGAGFTGYHQVGLTVVGNQISLLTNWGGYTGSSRRWAMYVFGPVDTAYMHNVNITGNTIKTQPESGFSRTNPLVEIKRVQNLNFVGNMLGHEDYGDCAVLKLHDCKDATVASNHFPHTNHWPIHADTVDGLNVNGNTFGLCSKSSDGATAWLVNCPKVLFTGNAKPTANPGGAWERLVQGSAIKRFVALGNNVELKGYGLSGAFFFSTGIDIEAMTAANPVSVTWTNHGMESGAKVKFIGITQANWTALNGNEYVITKTGANTFTINVNGTGFGAYVPGTDPGTYWFQEIIGNLVFAQ